jgi:hypothetical protein
MASRRFNHHAVPRADGRDVAASWAICLALLVVLIVAGGLAPHGLGLAQQAPLSQERSAASPTSLS